uniref:Diaminopimelate decarboxylase n=1 Tax=uncultured bacterium A1Q1_fos_1815 TaxID=1256553 RepID=L7VZ45_9BACT|nr:diaminopimelate decarboxylase [uncultured bacterium A1Q1_fos_1815]
MTTANLFPTLRRDIAGIAVSELVSRYGTPTYIYDASTINQKIDDLKAFDVIRYAQKACNNIAILDRMRKKGVVVDAVTAGEVQRALKAGYQPHGEPHPIVYTSDLLDRAGAEIVKRLGLHVNCGSPDMIRQMSELMPGCSITLRINPGFGHGHSQKTNTGGPQSKHGIWHENLQDCLLMADRHGVMISGVHMHIGSGTDLEHLAQVSGSMEQIVEQVGRSVTTISAGGGLPVPYRQGQSYIDIDRYFQLWNASRNRLQEKFGHKIRLEIEPGRYLVAESGFLVAEIRSVKKMGENLFYLVDAGFNDLARPILYGAYHPISIVKRDGSTPNHEVDVVVAGPLCESGDIFTQEEGGFVAKRRLPVAEVGDYLVLEVAGAYGFVMSSNYNGRFRAEEVLIENGVPHTIRKRETFDDLVRGECIP